MARIMKDRGDAVFKPLSFNIAQGQHLTKYL